MGINSNASNDAVVESKKLLTGIAKLQVLAINPTNKEIETLYGRPAKEEPNYVTTSPDGNPVVRIEIHAKVLDTKDTKVKFSYFIEQKEMFSKTSKTQYINKFGKTTWVVEESELSGKEWYKDEGSRKCLRGEEMFTNIFLRNAGNVASEGECIVDDWSKVFKGDFSELKSLAKVLKDNIFKGLLGVRKTDDGKMYQDVYTKWFERAYINTTSKFITALSGDNGQFGNKNNPVDYQNDFTLKEYIPSADTAAKPDAEVKTSSMF